MDIMTSLAFSLRYMTVLYANDDNSPWEADASFSMGSGATFNASSDSKETVVFGVGFSF